MDKNGINALDQVLEGVNEDISRTIMDALAIYHVPTKHSQDDQNKAIKLRAAFTQLQKFLLTQKLPDLNEAQWIFLSTGAFGSKVNVKQNGKSLDVQLIPEKVYELLVQAREEKKARPAWAVPILDMEDRVHAIARGEVVGLDPKQTRRRPKPSKPLGADQMKEKVKSRLETMSANFKELLGGLDSRVGDFGMLRDEQVMKALKLNLEMLKKFHEIVNQNDLANVQALKVKGAFADKLPPLIGALSTLGNQLEKTGKELAASGQLIETKFKEMRNSLGDLEKLEEGSGATTVFDDQAKETIRVDADMIASYVVRAAEANENKMPYSASRVLVADQWQGFEGTPKDRLVTPMAVVAAIEKISSIHTNVFPKDDYGHFVLPPILIEPIRNYVEYFDDRFVIALVSGDNPLKGPKISLTPVEVLVLRACGQYLSKDDLFDYRGNMNVGTFIGEYAGKVEKKTQVKWTGAEKKFSMAVSSEVADGASREEAVKDYMDFFFCMANGLTPPHKLSKRKVGVLLRFCQFGTIENTIGLNLMHVALYEPEIAKDNILKYGKSAQEVRDLVNKAFEDPQVEKTCGDRDFFITKLFGKSF